MSESAIWFCCPAKSDGYRSEAHSMVFISFSSVNGAARDMYHGNLTRYGNTNGA